MRLTKAQRELLDWIASQEAGVTDISDEREVRKLVADGLVLKFFETVPPRRDLEPVWTITDAGRAALKGEM